MRRLVVNTLALAVVLAGVGIGLGQQQGNAPTKRAVEEEETPKPKQKAVRVEEEEVVKTIVAPANAPAKSKLEEMLAEALKNNPDIRVAAAKVAEADAELNRTRLQVTQKVVALYYAIDTQKKTVEHQEAKYKRLQNLVASAGASSEELDEAKQTLALAKAKLAELEAQVPALVGKTARSIAQAPLSVEDRHVLDALEEYELSPQLDPATRRRLWLDLTGTLPPPAKVQGPLAERIRKALQTPVKVDYKDMPFRDVLKDLEKKAPDLSFHIRDVGLVAYKEGAGEPKLTLRFDMPLPIAAILQAIQDHTGSRFFVRDYGILVTSVVEPRGAMTVEELLRQKPTDAPRGPGAKLRNPPAENVEGLVKRVEESSGLMTISIGSDAGLAKGHTLELFRLNPSATSQSKYLGTIRILEVKATEAVAQPVGRLATPPQVGDRVASRILGN